MLFLLQESLSLGSTTNFPFSKRLWVSGCDIVFTVQLLFPYGAWCWLHSNKSFLLSILCGYYLLCLFIQYVSVTENNKNILLHLHNSAAVNRRSLRKFRHLKATSKLALNWCIGATHLKSMTKWTKKCEIEKNKFHFSFSCD